ncbi:hypothetical protein BCR35DRAFT_307424 [Leucosporidium creatinivorum]|uniref:Zn(2)-C6 fungal-type domain-containing protein n=1 Tax=Leucosporidium creatinivorum TaxID=106004 RepID=A0A1Y2EMV6_9BASI|nr:hypothetical protein BCR35DRAFT_307424 [Leucosporidium creatinivorum]
MAKQATEKALSTRPKFTRSRNGCRTCVRRKKRCPEVYNDDGACERCETGGFTCERDVQRARPPPPAHVSPSPKLVETPPYERRKGLEAHEQTCPSPASPPNLPLARSSPPNSLFPLPLFKTTDTICSSTASTIPISSSLSLPLSTESYKPAPFPPFTELHYSAALLSLFASLPPSMPPAGHLRTWMNTSDAGYHLRAMVLREMDAGERFEGAEVGQARLEEAIAIYRDHDDEWLSGAPSPELVKDHLLTVIHSHPTTQASCMAVTTFLQARLASSMSIGAQDRLLKLSEGYRHQAMQALASAPFEVQVLALFDIMMQQTEQHGVAAGYSIQSLIDTLIISQPSLGSNPPPFLPGALGTTNFLLRIIFFMDVFRAVALGRRTLFDFSHSSPLPTYSLFDGIVIDGRNHLMKGVDPALILFLARTSNLAVDFRERKGSPAVLQGAAELLENEIMAWEPSPAEDADSVATSQMWEEAILINLRQTIYRIGPLHPSIRTSLKRIISLGLGVLPPSPSLLSETTYAPLASVERALPWFFAATCALSEQDRRICADGLRVSTPLSAGLNAPVVEKLWELSDASGMPIVDWRSALAAEGIVVMIM